METYFNRIKGRIRSLIRTDGTSLFQAWRKDSLEWRYEEKGFCVQPEEGYGPLDPNGFKEVPKSEIPAAAQKVGTALNAAQGLAGKNRVVHVSEVKQERVILDLNHPGFVRRFSRLWSRGPLR